MSQDVNGLSSLIIFVFTLKKKRWKENISTYYKFDEMWKRILVIYVTFVK